MPAHGLPRFKALTLARLADGISDASILVVYDSRFRPGQPPSDRWLAHQRGKITAGLPPFRLRRPTRTKPTSSSIGLSCALGYLDWRKQVEWRRLIPVCRVANGNSPHTSRPSPARARRLHERVSMTQHTADTAADPPYWMASPSRPKLKLPPGACDAHVHVFGPRKRFPFADGRNYTPSDATKEMLFALHERLGIEHCVIVQPNCHGRDNSVTVDAIAATGQSYRGIALVPTDVSDAELMRLDAVGLCGARFHYMEHLAKGAPIDEVIAFAKRLADIGWHLQIHMEGTLIAGSGARAQTFASAGASSTTSGRVDAALGLEQPGFRALLRLMQDKHVLGEGERHRPHHAARPALRRRGAVRAQAGG